MFLLFCDYCTCRCWWSVRRRTPRTTCASPTPTSTTAGWSPASPPRSATTSPPPTSPPPGLVFCHWHRKEERLRPPLAILCPPPPFSIWSLPALPLCPHTLSIRQSQSWLSYRKSIKKCHHYVQPIKKETCRRVERKGPRKTCYGKQNQLNMRTNKFSFHNSSGIRRINECL